MDSSAMDSSTMDSSAIDSSALDSSAVGVHVGVAVLVGKCIQGPDIQSIRVCRNFPNSYLLFTN